MQLILTGYRGVGKSTTGRIVAAKLRMKFIDTDSEIEKEAGMPIPKIVASEGWDGFRRRESRQVRAALKQDAVIAAGGGALVENKIRLPKSATVILLTANAATIARRIKGAGRPPLSAKGTLKEIKEVMSKRMPAYLKSADIIIDTSGKTPSAVAGEIIKVIK